MEGLDRIVAEHRLFEGLGDEFIKLAAGCAKNVRFNADQYLFHAEDPADWIYLVRHGRVALELATPGRGAVQFETDRERFIGRGQMTRFPAALTGTEQDLVATPSTWTVQAPHWAMPQPNLVPVSPSVSRRTQSNGVSGSTSTSCVCPLIVRRDIILLLNRLAAPSRESSGADPKPSAGPPPMPLSGLVTVTLR